MKRLILLAGLPGSGKTTICRHMDEMILASRVDVDYYKRQRADPSRVTEEVDPPEVRWLYCRDALEEALQLFESGVSTVVMDEVYPYISVRTEMENLCAEKGIVVVWVEVRTSSDTAVQRLSTPREGHLLCTPEIAQKIYSMCARAFQPFSVNAINHTVIHNEDGADIDSLVWEIFKFV